MLKSVYLNYTSDTNEHYLTLEGYQQVRELVLKLRICKTCKLPFVVEEQRPCVGLRLCLSCFLENHPKLRLLGIEKVNSDGEATYTFLHEDGKVYTSRENYSDKPSEDVAYTLRQYGFNPPQTYKPFRQETEINLYPGDFQIYGDLNASVIVVDYNDYYRKDHITFLLYKNAGFKELTRRGEGRTMFAKAEAILEKLKLPNGEYFIDGQVHMRIYDGDLYRVISKLESAMYDISLQFGLPARTEPKQENEDVSDTHENETTELSVASEEESQETEIPVPSEEIATAIHMQDPENQGPSIEKMQPKRKGRPRLSLVKSTDAEEKEKANLQEDTESGGTQEIPSENAGNPGAIEDRVIGEINSEDMPVEKEEFDVEQS